MNPAEVSEGASSTRASGEETVQHSAAAEGPFSHDGSYYVPAKSIAGWSAVVARGWHSHVPAPSEFASFVPAANAAVALFPGTTSEGPRVVDVFY